MVAVQAGLIGPQADGTTPQQNPLDVERHMFWANQGRSGIIKGLVPSVVAGQMQLSFTPGAAVVCERDAAQVELDRAYPLYSPATAVVQFGAASAAARNDAVVAAVVDVEDGAQGTGNIGVGGHLVVVPGVSGVTAVRTDAQIAAYLGRGGFHRLYDVPIAAGSTQINLAGATLTGFKINDWNTVPSVTAATGWSLTSAQYMLYGLLPMVRLRIIATRTGATITAGSDGNISDTDVCNNLPTFLRAVGTTAYGTFVQPGTALGSARVNTTGLVTITDLHPNATVDNTEEIKIDFDYPLV